jgi:hypothetical protein
VVDVVDDAVALFQLEDVRTAARKSSGTMMRWSESTWMPSFWLIL